MIVVSLSLNFLLILLLMSSISSVERVFPHEYIYPEWFTKKKYKFYETVEFRLKKLRYIHSRSSEYYEKLNLWIFAPSISITALSSIGSFLSTSDFIGNSQSVFGITVGVLASISAMLQSLASSCKYSAKAEAHRGAADQYNKLLVKLQFEMEMPNEENFTDQIEIDILEVHNKCNYFPPTFIIDEWRMKQKRMKLIDYSESTAV